MYAIEFEVDVQDGVIKIPIQYKELYSKHIKVIALLDDVQTIKSSPKKQDQEKRLFSEEYIKEHWLDLIMTSSTDPLQDDDEFLQEEYGDYLSEKHSS
jgi:hypothetical protein